MRSVGYQMLERFLDFIGSKELIAPGDRILLAVSGGIDSCVMAHLFSKTGLNIGIAHCNFFLRGEESNADERFVATLAEKLKRPFYSRTFETMKFAEDHGYSIQQAARILRYQWFEELCLTKNYQKLATAHHLNDSIETFYINLLRKSGPAGLRGIPVKNGRIIRPMLFARKTEIELYATMEKVVYRVDRSNESDEYLRNRIRHHLIPGLMKKDANFEDHVLKMMDDYSRIHQLTMRLMDDWKLKHVRKDEEGNYLVPLKELLKEENVPYFLSFLLYSYGIKHVNCEKILKVNTPGKLFHSDNYSILRDRDYLILRKDEVGQPVDFEISHLPAELQAGRKSISLVESDQAVSSGSRNLQVIDAEKASLPLTLRTWKAGDFFYPVGMKGKKKISDYYTDIKLNRFQKDNTLLLLSGKDIVCILGHRIDDRFKTTPETKKFLHIEMR